MDIFDFLLNELLAIDEFGMIPMCPYLDLLFVFELSMIFKYNFKPIAPAFTFIVQQFKKLFTGIVFKIPHNPVRMRLPLVRKKRTFH
jgi:hypothetical protein